MDIVLLSKEEKSAIVIENKIWSSESSHQLNTYFEQSLLEYSDCDHLLYVFLTPEGYDSSNPERWISLPYEDVINALESAVKEKHISPEVSLIVQNYISIVRKKIMKERDEELFRICNDIYNKHRTALRLIFENVNVDNSADSEIICNELRQLSNEGKIIYGEGNRWSFATEKMNEFLPELAEANSSWGTNYVYWYWFEKYDESLIIHFELGGRNITDEHSERMAALISAAGKKKDDFRYKRLYYKKVKLSQDNYEESLKKAVRTLVEGAIKNEKVFLDKAKEILNA